jgi:HD-like signal output (HDOD) protein
MQLGRTHRAQVRFPIHFTAPDRSKTYIGETIDISANGFSVQVRTEDPLPTIILAGLLPTDVAGDTVLCKARVVWQGGLAGGTKRASYKITSIAQKSQERLDQIIQESVTGLITELQDLPLFADASRRDLESLLHIARSRDVPADTVLYDALGKSGTGAIIVLEGSVAQADHAKDARVWGPGSVLGQWSDATVAPTPPTLKTLADVRMLHLPTPLLGELEQGAPVLAARVRDALGHVVRSDADNSHTSRRRRLKPNILNELQEIPTLPVIFNTLMDCIEDPESTPRDLAHIIRKDQSLTTKILKTVNSALYGFSRRIGSVDEAVVLLGMSQTASLATTAMLLNTLVDPRRPERRPEAFWEHSLGSAYIAMAIGESVRRAQSAVRSDVAVSTHRGSARDTAVEETENRGSAAVAAASVAETSDAATRTRRSRLSLPLDRLFTLAVVHDIGLVALYIKFPEHFEAVQSAVSEFRTFHRAEMELLEVDHCQLGYRIAQAWRLPEPMPTVIAEHHLPQVWSEEMEDRDKLRELLREDPLVTLISLADLMTRHSLIGIEQDAQPPAIPAVFLEALGLSEEDAGEILAQCPLIKEKAELFFRGLTV